MAELEAMLTAQGGSCAICRRHWMECPAAKKSRHERVFIQHLYVDHDHETGAVRGLLCNNCNTAIALFADDHIRMENAIAYLQRHAQRKDAQ